MTQPGYIPNSTGKFMSYDFMGRTTTDLSSKHLFAHAYAPIRAGGSFAATDFPLIGDGSPGNPITVSPGDECDQLQYTGGAWRIIQTPAWCQTTVGTTNAAYSTVSSALAAGCNFVRVTTNGVSETGGAITFPATVGSYLIYIDPGVTYNLTSASTLGGNTLILRGSGSTSTLSYTLSVSSSCFSGTGTLLVDHLNVVNASSVATTPLTSPAIPVTMDTCSVTIPNISAGFLGQDNTTAITASLDQLNITCGGTSCANIIIGSSTSVVRATHIRIAGTSTSTGNLIDLNAANIVLADWSTVELVGAGANVIIQGNLSNMIMTNQNFTISLTSRLDNILMRNLTLSSTNHHLTNITVTDLDLSSLSQSRLENINVSGVLTTATISTRNQISNIRFASATSDSVTIGDRNQWTNVRYSGSTALTVTMTVGNAQIQGWTHDNAVGLTITGTNSELADIIIPTSVANTLTIGTTGVGTLLRLTNIQCDTLAIHADARDIVCSNVLCNSVTTPALVSAASTFYNITLDNLHQNSATTQTLNCDRGWNVTNCIFEGAVTFNMSGCHIENIRLVGNGSFFTPNASDGVGAVVSHVSNTTGSGTFTFTFGNDTTACSNIRFSDIFIRSATGTLIFNNCTNLTIDSFGVNCTTSNTVTIGSLAAVAITQCSFANLYCAPTFTSTVNIGSTTPASAVTNSTFTDILARNLIVRRTSVSTFDNIYLDNILTIGDSTSLGDLNTTQCAFSNLVIRADGLGNTSFVNGPELTFSNVSNAGGFQILGSSQTWSGVQQTTSSTTEWRINADTSSFSDMIVRGTGFVGSTGFLGITTVTINQIKLSNCQFAGNFQFANTSNAAMTINDADINNCRFVTATVGNISAATTLDIRRLNLSNCHFTGVTTFSNVTAGTASTSNMNLSNCVFTANTIINNMVSGSSSVMNNVHLSNCQFDATATFNTNALGSSSITGLKLANCQFVGAAIFSQLTGGTTSTITNPLITDCSFGDIFTFSTAAGGTTSLIDNAKISNCHFTGAATFARITAGTSSTLNVPLITDCHFASTFTFADSTAGTSTIDNAKISNSHFVGTATFVNTGVGVGTSTITDTLMVNNHFVGSVLWRQGTGTRTATEVWINNCMFDTTPTSLDFVRGCVNDCRFTASGHSVTIVQTDVVVTNNLVGVQGGAGSEITFTLAANRCYATGNYKNTNPGVAPFFGTNDPARPTFGATGLDHRNFNFMGW